MPRGWDPERRCSQLLFAFALFALRTTADKVKTFVLTTRCGGKMGITVRT